MLYRLLVDPIKRCLSYGDSVKEVFLLILFYQGLLKLYIDECHVDKEKFSEKLCKIIQRIGEDTYKSN